MVKVDSMTKSHTCWEHHAALNGGVTGGVNGITLTTGGLGGNIALNGAVSTTGAVSVATNGGAIIAGAGNSVTGNSIGLAGTAIGATGAALNTATSTLNATGTNGGVFVNNTGTLALAASATGGLLDVGTSGALTVASASGSGVMLTTLAAGAGITVNGAVNGGTGPVSPGCRRRR